MRGQPLHTWYEWLFLTLASVGVGVGVIAATQSAPWPIMQIIGWIVGSLAISVPMWVGVAEIIRRVRRED